MASLAETRVRVDRAIGKIRALRAERDRLVAENARLRDALLAESVKGDEARLLDAENAGSQLTAEKLLEIARTGEHAGTFGGETVEACAQAILRLRAALVEIRTTLRMWDRSALEGNHIGDDETRSVEAIIADVLAPEVGHG